MYGLGETGAKGWGDPTVLICIFGGLALGVVFILVEKREPPVIPTAGVQGSGSCRRDGRALSRPEFAQGSAQANLTELMRRPRVDTQPDSGRSSRFRWSSSASSGVTHRLDGGKGNLSSAGASH